MEIKTFLDLCTVIGLIGAVWHGIAAYRQTAVWRWYWAETKRSRRAAAKRRGCVSLP